MGGDWNELEHNILECILERLRPKDLAAARLTCKEWQAAIGSKVQYLTPRFPVADVGRVFPNLTSLDLTRLHDKRHPTEPHPVGCNCQGWEQSCRGEERVWYATVSDEEVLECVSNLPELSHLVVRHISPGRLLDRLPKLTSLVDWHLRHWEPVKEGPSGLVSLDLSDGCMTHDDCLNLGTLTSLTTLKLPFVGESCAKGGQKLPKEEAVFPNAPLTLQELSLTRVPASSALMTCQRLKALNRLTLDLDECAAEKTQELIEELAHLPHLCHLSLQLEDTSSIQAFDITPLSGLLSFDGNFPIASFEDSDSETPYIEFGCSTWPALQNLKLQNAAISLEKSNWRNLKNLEAMQLAWSCMPTADLEKLCKVAHSLKVLDLGYVQLLGAQQAPRGGQISAIDAIDDLHALHSLEVLNLEGSNVTDDAIGDLVSLTNLRCLGLADCTLITGEGLQKLSALPNLSELSIRATKGSPHDDRHKGNMRVNAVAQLSSLKILDLGYHAHDEDHMTELAKLSNLVALNVDGHGQRLDSPACIDMCMALTSLVWLKLSNPAEPDEVKLSDTVRRRRFDKARKGPLGKLYRKHPSIVAMPPLFVRHVPEALDGPLKGLVHVSRDQFHDFRASRSDHFGTSH